MAVASVTTDQILQAYRDTLGRTPGPEEVNFWVNYSTTNDPTQTANAFLAGAQDELASRQAINIPAATSSDLVLNLPTRTTIPAPVDVSSLAATGPVRPVPQPSVTSDQIVESYTKYLNRTPSADEIAFWTDYSKTNDPTQTAEAFLAGAKNEIANVTKSGYESYLGRTPNQEELNFWTNYTVEQGAPQAAAAWKAGADQELAARNVPSSVTEQQILDSYNKFFNRTPSADEVSFWVNYGRTADPTQTANAFINSARKEIGDITKSGYESYLGREPSQDELDFWTNYTIENDAVQAANAWKAGADEELIRRKAAVDVDTTLQNSNLTGSLVSESTAGIPYAGGIYKRTPQEEVMYLKELSRIPVNAAVPLPVMPMSLGPSDALTRARQPGDIGEGAYYAAIRDVVTSGDYTPAQLRQMQRNVGTSGQDINVAFGRGMTPISTTAPTLPGATAGTTQSIDQFIQSKAPTTSVAMPTAPSMFSPENVRAQLELERLRLQPTPEPPPEEPVAGFAQGGLVGDDINRMLQNQRNAIQRESQSRQMLTNLGAPPVKKFSDGGPAGSSSGVRRLKMSGYQEGGEVTDEMFVGTLPTDQGTNPGILPPEIRKPVDVGLDLANTALRGTAAAVAGPVYGLYKGVTGGQYGTPEGVRVGEQAATNLMSTITGEPKTQGARDIMDFVGQKVEEAKIPMMPQFLTMPLPAPGSARAAMRALDMDKPPTGAVTLAAPPTPSLDSLGMSSRLSEAVDRLQARGTGEQLLAQLNKAQGVPQAEIKATGLDEFLKSAGKVTRDDIQGYLEKNRVNLVEDERSFAGAPIDDLSKKTMGKEFPYLRGDFFNRRYANLDQVKEAGYNALKAERDELQEQFTYGDLNLFRDRDGFEVLPDELDDWFRRENDYLEQYIDDIALEDSRVKHNQLTLPGGDNYREVLFKLPKKEGQQAFIPPASHYEDAANTFGSIRMTDRVVDGKPILFAEEVQSDWAIKGAKEGYDEPEKAARRNQQLSEARQALAQAEARAEAAKKAFQNRGPQDESLQLLGNMEFAQQNAEKVRRFIQALEIKATPENPFKNNWYQPVMNRFLIKAAQEGKAGIGLTNGEVHIQRYNLRNYTDKVIYNPKTKLFAVFDRATDDVAKNIYQNIDEPKLRRMIGDETAEKLLNSGSKTDSAMGDDIFVLSGNQLEIGGSGKNTFYDKILPDYLNKLGKKYGVKVETRKLPAFSDQQKSTVNPLGRISDEKAREIYYLPLTEEMRNDLLGKGLPTFKEGGEVTNDEFIQQVMTGTPMSDTSTRPGILPPELREAIDVPLDFANLLIRGTAAVPIGGFAGLYKGLTGGKYGTQEGVKEADTEAARMMAEITGEPKTQTAKDVLQSIGDTMQKYKLDAAVPQLLTLPSPGAGTTEFIKQAVRSEFEAPPVGAVDIGALMPKPKKGVELSEQEVGKLVDSSQVSDEQAPALVETARRVKEIFNTNQGWEPMELIRAKIKPGKEDNLAVDLEAQKIPYNFHIVPEGMAKPAWEKKISNGIVGEVRKVVERAKAGDQKALDILSQASWYRSMRKRLRTEFGSIGDVFADVLGTTSAQTGVEQNFNNAIEILRRYSRGEYDKELKAYEDRLKSGESMDGTELTQLHKKGEFPLITKASGALFNANSPSSMGALLDMFRSVRTGDSPKTPNFTGNLIGLTNEATVDVWAARLLRRLSGKKRIPPMAEKGVSGKHLVGSTLYEPKVGGEFGFGQKVFKDAANRINKTGVIKNFDPKIGDVGPDDLQAIAWFIEKERWTDNGWTSKAGEGGSLEYEMSFAGAPNQAMVNDLRREINKGFKEPPQRKKESDQDHALRVEAARQAYDGNRQNLINQLSLLKKDVDRYQIGLSGERPGKPLASGYQRAELAAGVDDVVRDDQNVIAYNLTNSYGSFMSEVERALNGEFVVRGNFDPIPLERRVVELGKEYDQDAVFLSKVLPDGQSANARPGIEIYFKEKVSPEQMAKVTERLRNYGVDGFTYVTDMRFSDRPGMQVRAGSPETAELTGLRFQYVPEFDDAYSPETRGAIIKGKERLYREILRGIITDGNVSDARMLYYDTKVFLKGGYDEYLARTTPGGSGRVRPGQPDSSDTARSAQGAAVGAELSGDVRDGRDQASSAPAAEGVKRRRGKGTTSAAEDLAAVSPTAPAVSRVDMGYKDVTKRVPELTKGANDLLEGKITWEDYNALVDQYKPVTPYSFVPQPATGADAMKALDSRKQKSFAVIQEGIKAGETAELRLDIPAYKDHGVWVNSIHRSGQPTSYASISSIKNARMIGPDDVRLQEKALEVATGQKTKGPFAVIKGEWSPVSEKEAVARAQQYLNDPEWTQVGYDPERHSYFYDRTTTQPVVSADEVLQIGPLVLAKNAKFAKKEQFKFKSGGEVNAFIKAKAK
jgi:hypothetical protein